MSTKVSEEAPKLAKRVALRHRANRDVTELEKQHQDLLTLFEFGSDAVIKQKDRETILTLVGELHDFVRQHYEIEEVLMEEWDVPSTHIDQHQAEHRAFLQFVEQFIHHASRANDILPMINMALHLVRVMFRNHIVGLDAELTTWIRDRPDRRQGSKATDTTLASSRSHLAFTAFEAAQSRVRLELETIRRQDAELALDRVQTVNRVLSQLVATEPAQRIEPPGMG